MAVLVTGASGYIGAALTSALLAAGHRVRGLVRAASVSRLPAGVEPVTGDALSTSSIAAALEDCSTLVHLVGTPHPAPWKARQFEQVDQASLFAAAAAAAPIPHLHFVYVSVAHPAPTMRAYIAVRRRSEQELDRLNLRRTILRPWYVLGPGHQWPRLLRPFYALAEALPATRPTALRLGLVTRPQIITALVWAVDNPPFESENPRILTVPGIRALSAGPSPIVG